MIFDFFILILEKNVPEIYFYNIMKFELLLEAIRDVKRDTTNMFVSIAIQANFMIFHLTILPYQH